MSKPIFNLLLILGLVYGTGIITAGRQAMTTAEAELAYVIRAPAPASFEPPRGRRARLIAPLRAAQHDIRTTLSRSGGVPIIPLLFDGWTALAGTSVIALRYPWVLLILLVTAGAARLLRRWKWAAVGGGVIAGLLALHLSGLAPWQPPPPDYAVPVADVIAQRDPLTPIVYALPPAHPVSYYRERTALTQGLALDIAWRDFTPAEATARLERVAAVWVIAPTDAEVLFNTLEQTHRPTDTQQTGGVRFVRYVRR